MAEPADDEQVYDSASVADTEQVAAELARSLAGGTVVALEGDLGAGKTQFVRGLVRGLGGDPRQVSSPTYVLLHVYGRPGRLSGTPPTTPIPHTSPTDLPDAMRLPVFHLDAYRVGGADDFEAIGFGELLEQAGVVVVEWPSRVADLLPADRIRVTIEATETDRRRITVCRPG